MLCCAQGEGSQHDAKNTWQLTARSHERTRDRWVAHVHDLSVDPSQGPFALCAISRCFANGRANSTANGQHATVAVTTRLLRAGDSGDSEDPEDGATVVVLCMFLCCGFYVGRRRQARARAAAEAAAQGQASPQAYTQLVQGTHVGVVVGGEEFDPARASHVAVRAPSPFLGLGLYVASD